MGMGYAARVARLQLREPLCRPPASHTRPVLLAYRPPTTFPCTSAHLHPSATAPSATASLLCAPLVPRAGVAALVALMFRRTKARPACFMPSHVWARNP
ncbi:hypothetical protein GMOD_00002655 [Pyrenophora seminiperda CCB06]|uniref:Uncharacterized protein n=1 Tax=Pyrenophora seminiperda CCB06 TaxID=1302712 RepID=A0A3M7M2U0_9PLEO|nr:hypothetical protein GMOD_00002655 [Pyrenophora seminiperda CCB06]